MDATRYLPFGGRLLIALTFAMSGLSKLADYNTTAGLISATKLPLPTPLSYAGAVAVEIACSAMLIVGFQARSASRFTASPPRCFSMPTSPIRTISFTS
jgi:putative oxidoreductase